MEARIWKENQWGYFNNRKLNDIHENSQNFLITSLQKDISETEAKRTQLIEDVKTFASSTELSNPKRISIMLPAGFDATLTSKPIVKKAACKALSFFHFCQDSEEKMRGIASLLNRMDYELYHLTSNNVDAIHLRRRKLKLAGTNENYAILNYAAEIFRIVGNAVSSLKQDMEEVLQAQVCDHKRSDVFTFFL